MQVARLVCLTRTFGQRFNFRYDLIRSFAMLQKIHCFRCLDLDLIMIYCLLTMMVAKVQTQPVYIVYQQLNHFPIGIQVILVVDQLTLLRTLAMLLNQYRLLFHTLKYHQLARRQRLLVSIGHQLQFFFLALERPVRLITCLEVVMLFHRDCVLQTCVVFTFMI